MPSLTPWDRGWRDYFTNTTCPYPPGSWTLREWVRGWSAAAADEHTTTRAVGLEDTEENILDYMVDPLIRW